MKILLPPITLLILSFNLNAQNMNSEYTEKVRNNASTFHQNFSTGDFEKNGELVNEKIYVNSNNAIVIGRHNFIERIKRFNTPFPTLQLKDRIIIVDENQVGLLYIMQGTQDGPYGNIPASGNKINVYAAEFFTMDDDAKMKELLTITQLDQLMKQITGADQVASYENVTLLPIKKTDADFKRTIKNNLDFYVQNFNSRDWLNLKKMFLPDAPIIVNGTVFKGADPLIDQLKNLVSEVPDMTYLLIRNVAEGDRGSIAYEVHGTINQGTTLNKKLVDVKQGIHFQFTPEGKISNAVIIFNSNDFQSQLK